MSLVGLANAGVPQSFFNLETSLSKLARPSTQALPSYRRPRSNEYASSVTGTPWMSGILDPLGGTYIVSPSEVGPENFTRRLGGDAPHFTSRKPVGASAAAAVNATTAAPAAIIA